MSEHKAMHELDSASLANRLKLNLGDSNAAEELARRYVTRMAEWCRKMGIRDIDDAVNEAWIDVVEKLNTYDRTKGAFRAWCHTVTRHAAISLWRKSNRHDQRREGGPIALDEQPDDVTDPADQVAQQIDQELELALVRVARQRVASRYDEEQMQAFDRRNAGEPASAIARDLGMDADAVYRLYYKILNEMRAETCRLSLEGPPKRP